MNDGHVYVVILGTGEVLNLRLGRKSFTCAAKFANDFCQDMSLGRMVTCDSFPVPSLICSVTSLLSLGEQSQTILAASVSHERHLASEQLQSGLTALTYHNSLESRR